MSIFYMPELYKKKEQTQKAVICFKILILYFFKAGKMSNVHIKLFKSSFLCFVYGHPIFSWQRNVSIMTFRLRSKTNACLCFVITTIVL